MAPLYLGSSTSDAFYMGGSAVQKIYLGSTEVWAPGGGGVSLLYGPHSGSGAGKDAPHLGPNSHLILSFNLNATQEPFVSVRDTSPAATSFQYVRRLDATSQTFSSSSILTWDDTQPRFGSGTQFNQNFYQYRQFAFQGNGGSAGSAITDTNGTITTYHMCDPGIGWNITTYAGNGTANSTMGHGCGQEPDFIMTWRNGDTGSGSTKIYHRGLGQSGFWGGNGSFVTSSSDPNTFTATTMQTGSFVSQNYNSNSIYYAMLCIYNVAGKVQTGTLNEAGSGTFSINCGFTPKVFYYKASSQSSDHYWCFRESGGTGNCDIYRYSDINEYNTNQTSVQFTATGVDFAAGQIGNNGSSTIVWFAIAE
jgi:hypothetical protein